MANKAGKALIGALVVGAISYLRKPGNREKAISVFNDAKGKVSNLTNKDNVSDKLDEVKESAQGLKSDVTDLKDEVKDEVEKKVDEASSSDSSLDFDNEQKEELDSEGGIQK